MRTTPSQRTKNLTNKNFEAPHDFAWSHHVPATNTARFATTGSLRQFTEAAAFDALSNLEGVHLGGARRRDVGAVLMASIGTGLRGGFGFRLLRSRFRRAQRGGCRFRLADGIGRHRRRRFNACWGLRFGANPSSRRTAWCGVGAVARVRRGNWLRCFRKIFCFFRILRLRRLDWRRHRGGCLRRYDSFDRAGPISHQITELVGLFGRRQKNACCKANRAGDQCSERDCKRFARHVMQPLTRMSAPVSHQTTFR